MFKKKKSPKERFEESLDRVLFHWPCVDGQKEPVRIADMLRGTQCFGATGSGKSSGFGKTVAFAFCEAGLGGLVLCVKPDERQAWERFAAKTGRTKDLVIFDEASGLQFNPIQYELSRSGKGAGETINLVDLIMNIYRLGKNYSSVSGGVSAGGFWGNALRRLLNRSIDLLKLSEESLSIINMREIVVSTLTKEESELYHECLYLVEKGTEEEKNESGKKLYMLHQNSYCLQCIEKVKAAFDELSEKDQWTFTLVHNYFLREFAKLADRTRSSIEEHFFGMVEPFLGGILKDLFGQGISPQLWPENTYMANKIFVIDFPVKHYFLAGIYSQGIIKYMWQQAMERRNPVDDGFQTPVFLYCDESQFLINPNYDALFQTTARSALVCTVYLTQSINNYYFSFGNQNGQAKARGLLANMATKVFHGNTCYDTNQYAADMIGRSITLMGSVSGRMTAGQGGSFSEQIHYQVQPNEFTTLKYGRKENNKMVEAIIVKTGPWAKTKDNYIKAAFKQD